MTRTIVDRVISAPRPLVFTWLSDAGRYSSSSTVLRARWLAAGARFPFGVHAVRSLISSTGWFREEITSYVPGDSIGYVIRAAFPPVRGSGHVRLLDDAQGTRVVWSSHIELALPGWAHGPAGYLVQRSAQRLLSGILDAAEQELAT
ncbi:hypothetical protein BHE97_08055 [Aeromicrobium sp. PE09-221]|uniref:SRPBCC family protein n=1 Tax=Aeromicrobium sp. PE09-221 TaxID=1898043 RepID=UPI000B3EE21B|nr:SRPBCC family protein [Aeromicrobium sp. PE09-221]OUZ10293.1 hypothetical protein BHE97_08055 [Aeromicrobium sp. PE09-221]